MNEPQESLRTIFLKALELEDEGERSAYLEQACGEDEAMRVKIETLIGACREAGGLLGHETSGPLPAQTMESSEPKSGAGASRWNVSSTEKPGEMIGHYKLLQKIGEGGHGTVYMAEQEERCAVGWR